MDEVVQCCVAAVLVVGEVVGVAQGGWSGAAAGGAALIAGGEGASLGGGDVVGEGFQPVYLA